MIELAPWSDGDLWVVERFLSDPEMMEHLGGAQSREQILDAHARYLETARSGTGAMFTVVVRPCHRRSSGTSATGTSPGEMSSSMRPDG